MKKNYKFLFSVITLVMFLAAGMLAHGNNPKEKDEGWTIVSIYPVNANASGLAWDGEYIYIGSYGGGMGSNVYRFNPDDGTNELFFSGVQSQAYGLTWDGEHLWTIDRVSPSSTFAFALKLDTAGNEIERFDLPGHYMSGIAFDNGDFWAATYYPDPGTVHKMEYNDTEEEWQETASFTPPEDQPWDLARQGDYIWIAEYNQSNLHQTELDGTLVATYPGSGYRTSGVVFDGTFLWYVSRESNGDSFLYKVDLSGGGTPQISVPTAFDFGNVTVGNSQTWNMNISNTGSGELVIDGLEFVENSPFSTSAVFPINIEPGNSETIEVVFNPVEIAIYEETAVLQTNDPAALTVEIALSGIGLASGPYLNITQEVIDYGNVRINSSSKDYLFVQNMGDAILEISGINTGSPHFYFGDQFEFPLVIEPVESMELPLWFFPSIAGLVESEASIMFNNPDQSPVTFDLSGSSEVIEFPIGDLIWQYEFTGSFDYQAKAFLQIPDINQDGIPDVVVGTRDNYIRAFNGNASGTGDIIWEIELGTVEYPKGFAIADDLNDDGLPDIIAGTAWGDRAVTAISSKTGEIIWRFETNIFGQGGWVYMIDVSRDYNGSGYRDVLAATGDDADGNGPKRVFCLDAQTGDVIWQTNPLGDAAFSVIGVPDFSDDGVPDVIAGVSTYANEGKVVGINGANGNIEWEFITSGTSVWALEQISDITDDGKNDIIAGSFNGFYYLMDVTDGNVVDGGSLGNSLILDFWKAGDLNGDGYEDIIPAYSSVHNAVAISGADGQLLWTTPISDQSWNVTILRDITGDGINDIAVGTLFNNNNVYFLDGSDGEILETVPSAAPVDAIGNIPDITVDGSVEVIAGGRNGFLGVYSGGLKVQTQEYEVTFVVTDDNDPAVPLENVLITVDYREMSAVTDESGIATLVLEPGNYEYTASLTGYFDTTGTFDVIDEEITVFIIMSEDDTSTEELVYPSGFAAYAYPNPFSVQTQIEFVLPRDADVSLKIYDSNGRRVLIHERTYPAGKNTFMWDGRGNDGQLLGNGLYFFEIEAADQVFRNRMMILRD
jgi:outer membrane protein assembly factor BamB